MRTQLLRAGLRAGLRLCPQVLQSRLQPQGRRLQVELLPDSFVVQGSGQLVRRPPRLRQVELLRFGLRTGLRLRPGLRTGLRLPVELQEELRSWRRPAGPPLQAQELQEELQ